jgi:hypothetical protein
MNKISFNPSELKVFKRTPAKDIAVSNSSNPFGISFKGKVLNCDVFESTQIKDKPSFTGAVKKRSILAASAIAGTFNAAKKFINESFSKVTESLGNINTLVNNISKKFDMNIVELVKSIRFTRNPYNCKSVNELAKRFNELNQAMTVAAV